MLGIHSGTLLGKWVRYVCTVGMYHSVSNVRTRLFEKEPDFDGALGIASKQKAAVMVDTSVLVDHEPVR
jgi:hypothetical protein